MLDGQGSVNFSLGAGHRIFVPYFLHLQCESKHLVFQGVLNFTSQLLHFKIQVIREVNRMTSLILKDLDHISLFYKIPTVDGHSPASPSISVISITSSPPNCVKQAENSDDKICSSPCKVRHRPRFFSSLELLGALVGYYSVVIAPRLWPQDGKCYESANY